MSSGRKLARERVQSGGVTRRTGTDNNHVFDCWVLFLIPFGVFVGAHVLIEIISGAFRVGFGR